MTQPNLNPKNDRNFAQTVRDLSARAISTIIPSSYATIFMLHRMQDPDTGSIGHKAEDLRRALSQLRGAGARFVSVEQLMKDVRSGSVPRGPLVSFTVDDGFEDQAKIAGPIFSEFDCPATYFLISGFLDGELWPWDAQVDYVFRRCRKQTVEVDVRGKNVCLYFQTEDHRNASRRAFREYCKTIPNDELNKLLPRLAAAADVEVPSKPPGEYSPMTWSTARELRESGIRFAPHTVSHRIVSKMTDEEAKFEIEHSFVRVTEELGSCDRVFAWPNGKNVDFGAREVDILSSLGFLGSVHTEPTLVPIGKMNQDAGIPEWGRVGFPESIVDVSRSASPIGKRRLRLMRWVDQRFGGKRGLHSLSKGIRAKVLRREKDFKNVNWTKVERLVFLCTGNICRSPYAEAYATAAGIDAISCGTNAVAAATANHVATQVGESRGVALFDHRSRNADEIDFAPGDLVVGFDLSQLTTLKKVTDEHGCQVSLLGIWGDLPGSIIADPYGCSADFFERCFESIEDCVDEIAARLDIRSEKKPLVDD